MSLKSKIEAVIYASEEPVTLAQLVVLLSEEAQSELDDLARRQSELPLGQDDAASPQPDASVADPADAGGLEAIEGPVTHGHIAIASAADLTSADTEDSAEPATADPAPVRTGAADATAGDAEPADSSTAAASVSDAGSAGAAAPLAPEAEKRLARERERAVRDYLRSVVDRLIRDYAESDRGLEIREVAGGFRFGTKPEYHDAVRGFVKNLKPALKLSLQALETLAVVAYKQPVTAAEISEIRGVDSAGVLGGLLTRKLIQTAGRKQVIGRPMLYKTTREFLVRFGLRDIQELPSMEEFERMAGELAEQEDLPMEATGSIIEHANARGDAEHIRQANGPAHPDPAASPTEEAGSEARQDTELPQENADESAGGAAAEPVDGESSEDAESSPRAEAEPASAEQDLP